MTLKPLGDSAWLVEFPEKSGLEALALVKGYLAALGQDRPAGVLDVVPAFASLAVHFEGENGLNILNWIKSASPLDHSTAGEEFVIPVAYGGENGPDLVEVAEKTGLSPAEVISLHAGASYTVAAVGFSPGFPYLLGLPERLNLPRRPTPRLVVPAGSVAVAGSQAGIYPFDSPGGWHVLGKTCIRLFDPLALRPALMRIGDRVRFSPVEKIEPIKKITHVREAQDSYGIEVITPGAMTTVQDLGRPGYESSGVSPGGAVDRQALRMANLIVGNAEDASAFEIFLIGPVLKFHSPAVISLVTSSGKSRAVAAGEIVDFSKLTDGVRAYLAVAGGLDVPRVLGSCATDLRAGFGGLDGRVLQAGDRLNFGVAGRSHDCGDWHVGRPQASAQIELRCITGIQQHWFSETAKRCIFDELYRVTPTSNRMGVRLAGPALFLDTPMEMISQPVACGSVQVPPDGQPIVLLAERQTIGGYPQIAQVISVDLPKLARAGTGTAIHFRKITWEEARGILRQAERDFKWLQTGLKLLPSRPCAPLI